MLRLVRLPVQNEETVQKVGSYVDEVGELGMVRFFAVRHYSAF